MKNKKPIHLTLSTKTDTRHPKNIHPITDQNPAHKKVTKIIFFQPQKTDKNNPKTQTETNLIPILPKVTVMSK